MRNLYKGIITIFLMLFFIFEVSMAQQSNSEIFEVGQEWFYKNRKGEDHSTIHIFEIVDAPDGKRMMSISFSDVKIFLHRKDKEAMNYMPHIPIFEEMLRAEVIQLAPEDYQATNRATSEEEFEGHNVWKEAFDNGEAGAYTIPLSEILDGIQTAVLDYAKEQPDYEFQGAI